jgi:hypothetical protein
MSHVLVCELIAFVFYFLYLSFFEWAFHKYLFHSPKFVKATFHAHTVVHHQVYKYELDSYQWHENHQADHAKENIAMAWFALPMFIAFHMPIFWVIEHFTHLSSMWGGLGAVVAYYTVYEYFHYCMHIPEQRWFETNAAFRFAKEHHRIHHKYMLQNLNVFFPLADLCLGTYRSAASVGNPAASKPAAKLATTVKPNVSPAETIRAITRKQAVAED